MSSSDDYDQDSDGPPPQPARDLQPVPRVVYRQVPTMNFGETGHQPRMSTRETPETISALFTPPDFARYLQRWAPNLPPLPLSEGMQGGLWFGVICLLISLALICAGAGFGAGGGVLGGGIVIGIVGLVALGFTREFVNGLRNPTRQAQRQQAWWTWESYRSLERWEFGQAAASANMANWHAQMIAMRQASELSAKQADERFWEGVEALPLEQQWHAVDYLWWAMANEYSTRLRGQVTPEQAPIPRYDDAVQYLTAYPQLW
jgi:hypothetical protein